MSVTEATFADQLVAEVPEARAVVDEHLLDQDGELLLHLLMSDLLRFVVQKFHGGERDVARRCLDFVDRALRDGDEGVANAVAVSFVEDVGSGPGETDAFVASWPTALLAEKARQDAWRE
jgi:hypothetical protein